MTDAYRTPDNPLARALEQGRADLARQRAEQEALREANDLALGCLRVLLATLDPPLTAYFEPTYTGPAERAVLVRLHAPTAAVGETVCAARDVTTMLEATVRTSAFAETVERLLRLERVALEQRAAAPAAVVPPAPVARPWTDEAWRDLWAGLGCAVGWAAVLLVGLLAGGGALAVPAPLLGAFVGAVGGHMLAPDQRAWREAAALRRAARKERRLARMRATRARLRARWPAPPPPTP